MIPNWLRESSLTNASLALLVEALPKSKMPRLQWSNSRLLLPKLILKTVLS